MSNNDLPAKPQREQFETEGEYEEALKEWEFFMKHGYWR